MFMKYPKEPKLDGDFKMEVTTRKEIPFFILTDEERENKQTIFVLQCQVMGIWATQELFKCMSNALIALAPKFEECEVTWRVVEKRIEDYQ